MGFVQFCPSWFELVDNGEQTCIAIPIAIAIAIPNANANAIDTQTQTQTRFWTQTQTQTKWELLSRSISGSALSFSSRQKREDKLN